MSLTREQILGAQDLETRAVACPEWGGDVLVRALTGTQRDALEASVLQDGKVRNLENFRARLLASAIVNDQGARLFKESDVLALGGKNAAVLDRLYAVAARLSGISQDDLEDLVGNSGGGPSGDSISDSPSP
jgi:hypothetical protein